MGIHGLHRPREWDAVAVVDVPGIPGERAVVVALGDGSVFVEAGEEGLDPTVFAAAIELARPYRVEAVRRSDDSWAVGARSIVAVELPDVHGDEVELVWDGSERSLRVDGEPTFGSVPELELLASSRHEAWVVRAQRLHGDVWEVAISPL